MTTITKTEAAQIIGCHPSTVGKIAQRGDLAATKVMGIWAFDEQQVRQFARTYDGSKRPKNLNKRAFDQPVGNGKRTKYQTKKVWSTVDEQIAAAVAGEIKPLRLNAAGEVIG